MTYVAYKIRWVILFGILVTAANRQFTVTAFAVRNGDIARYFDVSPYQVDVLSVGDSIVGTLTCLSLSVIGSYVGIRTSSLITGCCSTLGSLLAFVGFLTRTYYCVFTGRLISGVSVGFMYILPGTFANAWFPSRQIATAFSATFVGLNFGGVIASLVFSFEFPAGSHNMSSNEDAMTAVRSLYSTVFVISTATLLCSTIIFCCFSKDRPPSPPSEAEALLSVTYCEDKPKFHFEIDSVKSAKLFCSRQFVVLTLAQFLNVSALVILLALMPSLITTAFPQKGISRTIRYVNISAFIGATCIAFASGRIVDRTKWYKGISCGGSLAAAMFGIGVALGHHFQSLITVCIFYPLMFVSRLATVTSLVEFLVETTHPTNTTVLVSLHFTFYNAAYFVMTSLERAAFHSGGPAVCNIVPTVGNLLGCICALMVKPDYRRTKANEADMMTGK